MNVEMFQYQIDAMKKMHNGCVLKAKGGTGKSRTALAYVYICELGGSLKINGVGQFEKPETPKDLYIITTAKKRDTQDWLEEVYYFCLPTSINVVVDSWNNVQKYVNVVGAMFIFDEQRTASGKKWAKAFIKIAKKNHWVMLSGTVGDNYSDYISLLIANGFYQSKSQFKAEHVVYKPFCKFPKIDHYINTKRLDYYISQILVEMKHDTEIEKHKIDIWCDYDKAKYKLVFKNRWDPYDDCPIEETGKLCYLLRRVCNEDVSRFKELEKIIEYTPRLIVFYNFSYELHALRDFFNAHGYLIGEWNGELHTPLPEGKKWVYLCQYAAASEGWNAVTTDTIVFFSQNYSYKTVTQAEWRTDRITTKFEKLYYYYFRSHSPIDISIKRALEQKRDFNEKDFMKGVKTTK